MSLKHMPYIKEGCQYSAALIRSPKGFRIEIFDSELEGSLPAFAIVANDTARVEFIKALSKEVEVDMVLYILPVVTRADIEALIATHEQPLGQQIDQELHRE